MGKLTFQFYPNDWEILKSILEIEGAWIRICAGLVVWRYGNQDTLESVECAANHPNKTGVLLKPYSQKTYAMVCIWITKT